MNCKTLIITLIGACALTAAACGSDSAEPAGTPDSTPETDTTAPEGDTTGPEEDVTTPEEDVTTPEEDVTTPEKDVTTPEEDVTTPEEDVTTPEEDVTAPEEDVTTPEEDVTAPEEDVTAPEEDVTAPEEDTAGPTPGCNTIAELTASEEGPVELTLCDVAVTVVYYNGYYVQEAGGDAMNIYVGEQLGEDNAWPYPAPAVGDVLSIPITVYGSFNGHQEVLASDAPTVTGTTTLDGYYSDLSAGDVPNEEMESSIVTVTGVTIDDIEGKTLKISYGTATDVQAYLSGTLQVCEGATMTITTGIITEYNGVHQIKIFEPATDVVDLDMTECLDEAYNWDFEDWSESNPPPNFIKTDGGDGFAVDQETENVHGGSSAAKLTIITQESTELAQAWYMDLEAATTATFDLWVVENDPNLKARLVLKFFNGTQEVGDNAKYSDYSADSADWVQLSVTREVPAEATQVRAYIRLYDENDFVTAGTASMIIDDWNLGL